MRLSLAGIDQPACHRCGGIDIGFYSGDFEGRAKVFFHCNRCDEPSIVLNLDVFLAGLAVLPDPDQPIKPKEEIPVLIQGLTLPENVADRLVLLCQMLVDRAGHPEAYDTEPRCQFRDLFRGNSSTGEPFTMRTPDGFEMYSHTGNMACMAAFQLVTAMPDLVDMRGINISRYEEVRARIKAGELKLEVVA